MYIISIESKIAFLEGLGVNASSPCGVCVCVAVSSPAHQLHSTFHLLNPRPIDASGHLLGAKQLMENLLRNTNIYTSHQRAVMQSWGRCRVNELIWYHCC